MRTTFGIDVPETRFTRAIHFIIGKASKSPFGVVLYAEERGAGGHVFLWFTNTGFRHLVTDAP